MPSSPLIGSYSSVYPEHAEGKIHFVEDVSGKRRAMEVAHYLPSLPHLSTLFTVKLVTSFVFTGRDVVTVEAICRRRTSKD